MIELWLFLAFGAMPDLALFLGIGRGLAKGQLHPRAVGLYNALHHPIAPIAFAAAALAFAPVLLAGAAGWATHIAVDRVAGYGLRASDGFQRA